MQVNTNFSFGPPINLTQEQEKQIIPRLIIDASSTELMYLEELLQSYIQKGFLIELSSVTLYELNNLRKAPYTDLPKTNSRYLLTEALKPNSLIFQTDIPEFNILEPGDNNYRDLLIIKHCLNHKSPCILLSSDILMVNLARSKNINCDYRAIQPSRTLNKNVFSFDGKKSIQYYGAKNIYFFVEKNGIYKLLNENQFVSIFQTGYIITVRSSNILVEEIILISTKYENNYVALSEFTITTIEDLENCKLPQIVADKIKSLL